MYSLFKKEIRQFFGSLIGYLVISVFLLIAGLFLWVFQGNYNIPDSGYASLDGLFEMAPWVYLFLIPAITMRMFADEKRGGTMELLLTKPVSSWQLVMGKYWASLILVLFSLLPTLLYYLSVYQLSSPVGVIDTGAAWGSYLGLFFLAAIYLSIGLFASSLTDNQIVAFIFGVLLCFVWYVGFDFVSDLQPESSWSLIFHEIGIDAHYKAVSRGVLELYDLAYFILMPGFFLILTYSVLSKNRRPLKSLQIKLGVYVIATLIVVKVVGMVSYRIDFTQEKRFTLSGQMRNLLAQAEEPIVVEIFLEGELQPGFEQLKTAVADKVDDIETSCPVRVFQQFTDPYEEVKPKERTRYFDALMTRGLRPTNVRIKTDKGTSDRLIFPSAVVRIGEEEVVVNFLQNNPNLPAEENLNRSIELLEYEFARALKVLLQKERVKVAFLEGHGELDQWQVNDLTNSLSESFDVVRLKTELLTNSADSVRVLIIADPELAFPERDKYFIDQYVMRGGRVMWLLDPVQVSLDSLSEGMTTLAYPRDFNLQDQLFRYGVRVGSDLILDAECLRIPVDVSLPGETPNFSPAPWVFSPLMLPNPNNPIGKNLNRVMGEFVSSVAFVGNDSLVKSTTLLSSSPYARHEQTPMEVSLAITREQPSRAAYQESFIPVGVLLEGQFQSVFQNRVLSNLNLPSNTELVKHSDFTKQMIFGDGNLIANKVRRGGSEPQTLPLGYDRYSRQTFGNREFFVNAVHYLADDSGLMHLRTRSLKLRLLDKVKVNEQRFFWQLVNVLLPLILVFIVAILVNILRKRRYSQSVNKII